jgi:hypothetical protein
MNADDEELEQLRAGVNCATLLEKFSYGWTLDRQESTRRALKYRCDGEILIVNHDGRGWWDPQSDAKGDVFNLVQHLDHSRTFGQVRKLLRGFVGMAPSFAPFARARQDPATRLPPDGRWDARRRLRRGSLTWHYLAATRCLPACVLTTAASLDALREGPYGSAWFAHRDHDGVLTGIEMRGPRYRGFSADGRKSLFRLPGSAGTVTRLAVCEAPIDALSLAALERVRADTLYVSTAGGMGPDTIAALELLLSDLSVRPCRRMAVATDADPAGERYAERLQQMAGAAGVPSERLHPPPGPKDWNELLQARARRDRR